MLEELAAAFNVAVMLGGILITCLIFTTSAMYRQMQKERKIRQTLEKDLWNYIMSMKNEVLTRDGPNIVPASRKQLRIGRWVIASVEEAKPPAPRNDYGGF